jgi:asparagine synthase (glutamine-hydrolysing)
MTFIAGVLRRDGDAFQICRRMLDGSSRKSSSPSVASPEPAVALGLSFVPILPEDSYDRQPLSEDRYLLVGDIRIDNRAELAAKLDLSSAYAAQLADSALLLRCWHKWNVDFVLHVIGGFAIAVWDKQEKELFLIRDHCGERPLYYSSNASLFAFASLPQGIRDIPGLDTTLNERQLLHYLAVGPDSTATTYFNNILLLQPGHTLRYREGRIVSKRYWHPADTPTTILKSDEDYVEAILERFDASVQARLRSAAKVGSQLSGGMDSSSVTATAARLLTPARLTAFTAIPHPDFSNLNPVGRFGNEGPAARAVAAMYPNIEHVFIEPSHGDMLRVIEKTGQLTGAPVFNPMNQMWFNAILDEASYRGINVMLQGACGNSTISFGGLIGLSKLFRSGRLLEWLHQVLSLRANGHISWRGAASWSASYAVPFWLRKLLNREIRAFDFAYSPVHPAQDREHKLRELALASFFGSETNVEQFRRKIFDFYDVGFSNAGVSVGWGISLRDPMQDKRVFEFCLSIPIEQYLAGGQSRSLVRRSMRDRLPPEVLACTTRGLQSADWYLTMGSRRKQMADELKLIAQSPLARHLLDIERLQNLLDSWPASGFERADVSDSWHLALSRGLAVGNFIRHFEAH